MSAVSRSQLNISKCYATSNGDYLGKYKNTTSITEGVVGRTTVCSFDERDVYDADKKTFKEVDCRTVGSPIVFKEFEDYVVDEMGKRKCPICHAVEGGTLRIITHYFGCKNKQGGRKNRKPTKKNRRRNRRSSKKNRRN
jgi:hypothetical protein